MSSRAAVHDLDGLKRQGAIAAAIPLQKPVASWLQGARGPGSTWVQGQASPRPGSAAGGRHSHMHAGCCWGCPSLDQTTAPLDHTGAVRTEPAPFGPNGRQFRPNGRRFGRNPGQFHPNYSHGGSTCWAEAPRRHCRAPLAMALPPRCQAGPPTPGPPPALPLPPSEACMQSSSHAYLQQASYSWRG